jgi:LysR family nitrogen assimilation transcriptional regulator
LEIRRLRAFTKVVEHGSLTRAAQKLGTTQPALSQQVSDLEAFFGVTLLVRTVRGVTPTAAGELLCRHINVILRQFEQAKLELRQSDAAISGAIAVGLPGSLSPILTVPLLTRVKERYPQINLRVVGGSYEFISNLTASGRVDLALSEPSKGVKSELLCTDELVLVSPPSFDDRLPPEQVELGELNGHPLIMPISWGVDRAAVYEDFSRNGLTLDVTAELESPTDLVAAARAALGSTILRWAAAVQLAPDLRIRRIIKPRLERAVYLTEPEIQPATSLNLTLKSLIRELVHDLITHGDWIGAALPDGATELRSMWSKSHNQARWM